MIFENPALLAQTRRHFFASGGFSLGGAALGTLLGNASRAAAAGSPTGIGAALRETHFPAKCKNIIYLHMVGGPAQMDLYDYKPEMEKHYGEDLPESIRKGQRQQDPHGGVRAAQGDRAEARGRCTGAGAAPPGAAARHYQGQEGEHLWRP